MNEPLRPLKIVGTAWRLPQRLDDLPMLWEALLNRLSATTSIPPERWTFDRRHSSNATAAGQASLRRCRGAWRQDVRAMFDVGADKWLDLGLHPVMAAALKDCIQAADKACRNACSLRRNAPERNGEHRTITSVCAADCGIDWRMYPVAPIEHPILGIQETRGAPVWRSDFDAESLFYLRDHVVDGKPVLPASAYVEGLLELAALQFAAGNGVAIRDLEIAAPMLIDVEGGLAGVTAYDPLQRTAIIRSLEKGRPELGPIRLTARLSSLAPFDASPLDLMSLPSAHPISLDTFEFYRRLSLIGLQHGPAFRSVRELRRDRRRAKVMARIDFDPLSCGDLEKYRLHPTLLDGCLQSLLALSDVDDVRWQPTGLGELCFYGVRSPSAVWCLGEKTLQTDRQIVCNLTLYDDQGRLVAAIRDLRFEAAARRERTDRFGEKVRRQILQYEWTYGETPNEPKRLGNWLIVGDAEGVDDLVRRRLTDFGATVSVAARLGDAFQQDGDEFIVRPGSSEDACRLLAACGELDGVLFLHGLAATPESNDPTAESALAALVALVQALLQHNSARRPRACLVTRGAFAIDEDDSPVRPGQTALSGFARAAFNELDGLTFTTVDLPTEACDASMERLTLELLVDDRHDEVAIRGGQRFVSMLVESRALSDDRVEYRGLSDQAPVQIRPLRNGVECVGMARIVATNQPTLGADDVRLRVEATLVPPHLLPESSGDGVPGPALALVAQVTAVGRNVRDLAPGRRVCGFGPADLASHLTIRRDQYPLTTIRSDADASALLGVLGLAVRAERAIEDLDLAADDVALVHVGGLGLTAAEALRRRDVRVALVADDPATVEPRIAREFPVYAAQPESIEHARAEQTGGRGFSALVVGLRSWLQRFDFRMLRSGGAVIDADETAGPTELAEHVRTIVRTDLKILLRNPRRLTETLRRVAPMIGGGVAAAPTIELSLADIAWQKLPLSEIRSTLVLTYDTRGAELPVVRTDELRFRSDATYWITGGFGGLGMKTAEWLIAHGACHLVLTGRAGADTPTRQSQVARLQSLGADVKSAACDVSDRSALERLFAEIAAEMPPLKGVFHSAAVTHDQSIAQIDRQTLETVMRSKAFGAWNLHLLTRDLPLEQFVLYSSVASLVGGKRQAVSNAANGFLNGLADLRRKLGLAATSVQWDVIADMGDGALDDHREQLVVEDGSRGIRGAEAFEALRQALARDVGQFGVTLNSSWGDCARCEARVATGLRR